MRYLPYTNSTFTFQGIRDPSCKFARWNCGLHGWKPHKSPLGKLTKTPCQIRVSDSGVAFGFEVNTWCLTWQFCEFVTSLGWWVHPRDLLQRLRLSDLQPIGELKFGHILNHLTGDSIKDSRWLNFPFSSIFSCMIFHTTRHRFYGTYHSLHRLEADFRIRSE